MQGTTESAAAEIGASLDEADDEIGVSVTGHSARRHGRGPITRYKFCGRLGQHAGSKNIGYL